MAMVRTENRPRLVSTTIKNGTTTEVWERSDKTRYTYSFPTKPTATKKAAPQKFHYTVREWNRYVAQSIIECIRKGQLSDAEQWKTWYVTDKPGTSDFKDADVDWTASPNHTKSDSKNSPPKTVTVGEANKYAVN